MCIIFASEGGNLPEQDKLRVAYDNNPHGVGFMWIDKGTVRTLKGMMKFHEAWNVLKLLEGKPYSCHFRWRTRGSMGQSTCHPFRIHTPDGGSAYIMHNGTLFSMPSSPTMSDTQLFAKRITDICTDLGVGVEAFHDKKFMDAVSSGIEPFNKLVFMTRYGMEFINRHAEGAFESGGIWYSNDYSFIPGYRKGKGRAIEEIPAVTKKSSAVTKKSKKEAPATERLLLVNNVKKRKKGSKESSKWVRVKSTRDQISVNWED